MSVVPYKNTVERFLKSPMRKTYTFVVVTLIVILIFLLGAIKPTFETISRLQGDIKQRKSVESRLQTKINNLQELQSVYNSIRNDLDFIEIFFPPDSDYSLLMASLERITGSYSFDMQSLGIKKIEETSNTVGDVYNGMEPVEIRISMVGRRSNIIVLLEHLENLPIIPEVTGVTYSPSDNNNSSEVNLTVSLLVYKTINSEFIED